MTNKEIFELLKSTGLEVAYDHFTKQVDPPLILYRNDSPDVFVADDTAYNITNSYVIWLITETKDLDMENKIEQLLIENHLPFEKNEEFIDSEQIYQIEYLI